MTCWLYIDLEAKEEKGYGEAKSSNRLASEGGEVCEEDVGGDLDAGGDGGDEQPGQEEEGARKEDAEEEREARYQDQGVQDKQQERHWVGQPEMCVFHSAFGIRKWVSKPRTCREKNTPCHLGSWGEEGSREEESMLASE